MVVVTATVAVVDRFAAMGYTRIGLELYWSCSVCLFTSFIGFDFVSYGSENVIPLCLIFRVIYYD